MICLLVGTGKPAVATDAQKPPPQAELEQFLADSESRDPQPTLLSVNPAAPVTPKRHFALGVNYTGTQLRWRFRSPWAAEARWQTGKASSDFGEVTANVYSLRGYRYIRQYRLGTFYLGSEVGFTQAKAGTSNYSVSGPAAGAFGGMDLRIAGNFHLGIDIGPYLLSLKEKQTQTTETYLDFILNTGVLWYLF